MRYLEDFVVGDRVTTASATLSEDDITSFAKLYDPQPMHTDPVAAKDSALGGLVASGWQTTAIVMRLLIEAQTMGGGPMLGLGVDDLRWPTPVRPGDAIHVQLEVMAVTPSQSKPTHGVVRTHVTAENQNGERVLSMFPKLWVERRVQGAE